MKLTTTLLIAGLAALLTGCGKSGYASNDNNSGSNNAQSVSQKLTQEELQTLADADQQELAAHLSYRSIGDAVSAAANLKIHLANIGDLAAQFDASECSPSAVATTTGSTTLSTVTWNCAHVAGSVAQMNTSMMMPGPGGVMIPVLSIPQSRTLNLIVSGTDVSLKLNHTLTNLSSLIPKREIDDLYTIGADQISVKGESSFDVLTSVMTASYDVVKNGGDADTISIALDGATVNMGNLTQPICGGSVKYETTSGLTYSKALPACAPPVVMPPGLPPGFPFPGLPNTL